MSMRFVQTRNLRWIRYLDHSAARQFVPTISVLNLVLEKKHTRALDMSATTCCTKLLSNRTFATICYTKFVRNNNKTSSLRHQLGAWLLKNYEWSATNGGNN